MSEIQVEVCFTDKLESVRVGGKAMEIPKAVKAKPVEEWFEPAAGRVKWGGLGAEINLMEGGGDTLQMVFPPGVLVESIHSSDCNAEQKTSQQQA